MANKKFTDFNIAAALNQGDYLIGYNALGTAELRMTFQTIQDSLPSDFKYQGTDLKDLSSNWQDTSTVVQENSALWATDSTVDAEVRALTSSWEDTFTVVQLNSSNWDSAYTSVSETSTNWDSVYSTTALVSADWQSTYTTVQSNSGAWTDSSNTYLKFLPLSGGDLTGSVSLSNVEVVAGETITSSVSSLVVTINGQQFKVPLLPV